MTIRLDKRPLAALICSLGISAAHAGTQTVSNTNDSGTGSLRQAIASAASGDTIVFSAGLTGTITLASSLSITNKTLTITGPGADALTVNGADLYRILAVNSDTETDSLTLRGLTLAHGRPSGAASGSCEDPGGYGGAICAQNVNLTITDSIFDRNHSDGGGAIFAVDYDKTATRKANSLAIARCLFSNNQISGGYGPAVFVAGPSGPMSVTIDHSEFDGNSAGPSGSSGGALSLYRARATITYSTFINNTTSGKGGAIDLDSGGSYVAGSVGLTVNNSTFNNNQGSYGGAISSNNQDLVILSSTLFGNHATVVGNGDALYAAASAGSNPSASIRNTILAGDSGSDTKFVNVVPTISYSLVQNPTGILHSSLSNSLIYIDPQIGALVPNGTSVSDFFSRAMHSFLPPTNSPVVNVGDPSSAGLLSYDQRGVGYARVQAGRVDMGAIEAAYAPGAPILTRVIPGSHSMKLYFSPPASDGGLAIDQYIALCTASGLLPAIQTGPTSPLIVSGLVKGASYTCTVGAHNTIGNGVQSTASIKVARPPNIVPVLQTILDH